MVLDPIVFTEIQNASEYDIRVNKDLKLDKDTGKMVAAISIKPSGNGKRQLSVRIPEISCRITKPKTNQTHPQVQFDMNSNVDFVDFVDSLYEKLFTLSYDRWMNKNWLRDDTHIDNEKSLRNIFKHMYQNRRLHDRKTMPMLTTNLTFNLTDKNGNVVESPCFVDENSTEFMNVSAVLLFKNISVEKTRIKIHIECKELALNVELPQPETDSDFDDEDLDNGPHEVLDESANATEESK